jgi:cytochrome c553
MNNLSSRDAARSPRKAAGAGISCLGCHSAHGAGSSAGASKLAGPLTQVKGMTAAGSIVASAASEYEICFRCHADTARSSSASLPRQFPQPNVRLQFSPANASYHPVVATAKSGDDATLLAPWNPASRMTCTDCHNNDQGPGAKGAGPKGPHGSRHAHLLERNLSGEDFKPESYDAYALCYKCHDQGTLLSDQLHRSHVREHQASCLTCHDPHGVKNQSRLINFNTIYVKPFNGQIVFTDRGSDRSACTLTCHGKAHDKAVYP